MVCRWKYLHELWRINVRHKLVRRCCTLIEKVHVTVGNNWDHDLPIIGQVIQLLQEPINLDFIIIVYWLD